jgi:uncharacterized protein (DUF433 family)
MYMELESYFETINDTAIRIRGTRIGIETIIDAYRTGATPEEILIRYPALSLLQIYAAITYYLARHDELEAYVGRVRAEQEAAWVEYEQTATPFLVELRTRLAQQRQILGSIQQKYLRIAS